MVKHLKVFTILIEKYFLKTALSGEILETKRLIFYPIIGAVFVGNLLILINYLTMNINPIKTNISIKGNKTKNHEIFL